MCWRCLRTENRKRLITIRGGPMNSAQWERIDFFRKEEGQWGDPDKINFDLIRTLDQFRYYTGQVMWVSCGTQGVHAQNSLHYDGFAVDIVFPNRKKHLVDLFVDASRFSFSEIGLYPDWEYRGETVGGLHLGKGAGLCLRKKYWVCVDAGKGKKEYSPCDVQNFLDLGIIEPSRPPEGKPVS